MAGDEDKKKKKKSKKDKEEKKVEEEAPPPEPEPEPEPVQEPEPVAEPEPTQGEHRDTVTTYWDEEPTQVEDAPPAEGEGEAPVEGLEGEEALEPPPAPKKKPKFFVHWNRRKPRFYDYNWDYGDNYYSSLVKYMDSRAGDFPRRMAFAERGIRSNVLRRTIPDTRTANLLDDVRKSIRNFELSQKTYMK